MSFLNGKFPGKVIVMKKEKLKRKNFEALKKIYPTAFFVTSREEVNELKTIFYIDDSINKNINKISFKKYLIENYSQVHIKELILNKVKTDSRFLLSEYKEKKFKMFEV